MPAEIQLLLPPLFILSGALVMMMLSPLKIGVQTRSLLTLLFLGAALGVNLSWIDQGFSYYLLPQYLNDIFIADTFSVLLSTLLILGAALTVLLGQHYFKTHAFFVPEFFSLLLFALFGMMMLTMSAELITIFIALEIASVSVYILVGLNSRHQRGVEALFKYLMLGSFAGAFFLFGIVLVYAFAGTTHLPRLADMIHASQGQDLSLMILGGTLMMVTILFKIAAFFFHSWSLDVYSGASMPVTAFLASTFKVAVFAVALRIFVVDFSLISDRWDSFLITAAVITLVGGSLLTLSQTNLKRMLISSGIVHSGYLLIALASTGATHNESAPSIIFYLIAYFMTAIGAFGLLSFVVGDDNRRVHYEDFKGLAYKRPMMAAAMTLFMLSFAGFPSTIGFLGKFYIFTGAIEAGYAYLAVLGVLAAFVSVYYYFKVIVMMYFYPAVTEFGKEKGVQLAPYVIGLLAFAVLWGGIGNMLITFLPGATVLIDSARLSIDSLSLVR